MFDPPELEKAKESLDALVQIELPAKSASKTVTFAQKLDRLSELIDALRFHIGFPDDSDTRNVFQPNNIFADPKAGRIYFVDDNSRRETLDDQAVRKLSMPLLDFLFTHPDSSRRVLTTIHAFIRSYLPDCRMIDFERTGTGVLRIVTNVRFAAHDLRRCKLLQYTHAEAFKRWRLSLLGILVADEFSTSAPSDGDEDKRLFSEILIFRRLDALNSFPFRVSRLENLVKGAALSDEARNAFLEKTMRLFEQYFKVVQGVASAPRGKRKDVAAALKLDSLLNELNESPEAVAVVEAFDSQRGKQEYLL